MMSDNQEYVIKAKLKETGEYTAIPFSNERQTYNVDFSSINEIRIVRCDNDCQDNDQDIIINDQDGAQCDSNDVGSCD